MMNLCTSKPHAEAGRGVDDEAPSTSATMPTLRILITIPPAISFLSVRRLRASHGSTSLRRLLSGVSSFGVSSSIGSPRNRGSFSEPPERLETEASLADVLVPIDAAAARLLRVVQVKHLEPIEADDAIELAEGAGVARLRCTDRSRP